jgi:hypothetical protein
MSISGTGDVYGDLLKVAETVADPEKAIYKGSVVTIVGQTGSLSQVLREGADPEWDSFSVKTTDLRPIPAPRAPSIPSYLERSNVTYDAAGVTAWFLGHLTRGVTFNLQMPERIENNVVNDLHSLTGVNYTGDPHIHLVPAMGKWGLQAEIKFEPTDTIPSTLKGKENKPGFIRGGAGEGGTGGLFWYLMEHGFSFNGKQDATRIREFMPDDAQKKFFDTGAAGIPLADIPVENA